MLIFRDISVIKIYNHSFSISYKCIKTNIINFKNNFLLRYFIFIHYFILFKCLFLIKNIFICREFLGNLNKKEIIMHANFGKKTKTKVGGNFFCSLEQKSIWMQLKKQTQLNVIFQETTVRQFLAKAIWQISFREFSKVYIF